MLSTALETVFEALDFADDQGLVTLASSDVGNGRAYVWREARDKLSIDAAYFQGDVPAVYFKEFQTIDDDSLWDLHRSLWNHNRVPLLIAVLPSEVRVYNCFAPPRRDPDQFDAEAPILLKKAIRSTADMFAIRQGLSDFRRREIVSGRFAKSHPGRFNRESRVDNRLLDNLKYIRHRLIHKEGLLEQVANSLLGRLIFVRYLEDREVLTKDYYRSYTGSRSIISLLQRSRDETYLLFDELAERFNGDLFPVNRVERDQVTTRHLKLLGRFLSGDDLSSGQMFFWAYDFKYIPIELISSIYETFLDEDRQNRSAYYTPPEIVDFVLNEVLPFKTQTNEIRILDPACGSGIFLVEVYRRLVMQRRRASGERNLDFGSLRDILVHSIFGVDLSEDAIQVAAFSCYLALLDFLEPKSIWEEARFPKLMGSNLYVNDFFDTNALFNEQRFDVIIGNPPWRSKLTGFAAEYVQRRKFPIGDKQIAQAFLWRAPELLADEGQMCILAPSKGVLFNQSVPNKTFRRRFFTKNDVTQIVDFSAFRRRLFREAVAPMVAVFCRKTTSKDNSRGELLYLSPHPSPISQALAGVVLFGDEVKRFSRRKIVDHPNIWKVALWGTPRDLNLIDDLRRRFPSLEDVGRERDWLIRVGATVSGSSAIHAPALAMMRYVPTDKVEPFHISSTQGERINREVFHRPGEPKVYAGPHVLIRGGPTAGGILASAFLSDDAVFQSGVIGIAGPPEDVDYLKVVCAYINSSLARYYQFLTSSTWGVERDVIRLTEHKTLPCAIPLQEAGLMRELVCLVDRVEESRGEGDWRAYLDDLVYKAYGMTRPEQYLIEDVLATAMDRHYRRLVSRAFEPPSVDELISFAQAYADVFESTIGWTKKLRPIVYDGTPPYRAVSFPLVPSDTPGIHPLKTEDSELDDLLSRLESIATEQHSQSLYSRRNIRVYESDAIHIVKPAEKRFWTRSAAYNDADETISELLRTASRRGDE